MSTLATILVLIPGFAFVTGYRLREPISRQVSPINTLGQIALAACVALTLHALALGIAPSCPNAFACVSWPALLALLTQDARALIAAPPALGLTTLYMILVSGTGGALGWFVASGVAHGYTGFARVAPHRWLYRIARRLPSNQYTDGGVVRCIVVSKTSYDGTSLVYEGTLVDLGVSELGEIKYVVLSHPATRYLTIASQPKTAPGDAKDIPSALEAFSTLSSAHRMSKKGPEWLPFARGNLAHLHLAADQIANIFFREVDWARSGSTPEVTKLTQQLDRMARTP